MSSGEVLKGESSRQYQILSNLDCNLDCTYCYEKKGRKSNNVDSIKSFVKYMLIEDLAQNKIDKNNTTLFLDFVGGESFLYPELMDEVFEYFIQLCKEHNISNHPRISISTNGTLLQTPKCKEFILKWQQYIHSGLSIDGVKEIHDKHRIFKDKKTGSFDIVLENLNWLKSFLCTKCQISIKSTWTVKNAKFYGESIIYLLGLGIKNVAANFIFEEKISKEDGKTIHSELIKIADYILNNNLENDVSFLQLSNDNIYSLIELEKSVKAGHLKNVDGNYCGSCKYMRCIGYDNKIYGCNRFLTMNKPGMEIGILENDKIKITNQSLIDDVSTQYLLWPKECKKCKLRRMCSNCSAVPYEEENVTQSSIKNFLKKKNMCEFTKAQYKAKMYYLHKYLQKHPEEIDRYTVNNINFLETNNIRLSPVLDKLDHDQLESNLHELEIQLKLIEDIILTYTNLIAKNLIHISDPKIEAYQSLQASIQNDIININKKLGYVLTCN